MPGRAAARLWVRQPSALLLGGVERAGPPKQPLVESLLCPAHRPLGLRRASWPP